MVPVKIVNNLNMNSVPENESSSAKKITFRSEELFQGTKEIVIEHSKEQYRLLITKSGKLILNKWHEVSSPHVLSGDPYQ